MNISYESYRIFYYVAKYRSLTQAANALLLNQPNLTRTVKNLEAALGCRLFVRSNKGMRLTPEGELLYQHISTAVEQIQEGEEAVTARRSLQSGMISVGVSEVALHCFLLSILQRFHDAYPGVRLKIANHSTPQSIAAVRSGLTDLSIVTTPTGSLHGLHAENVSSFQETAVCSEAFSGLTGRPVTLAELSAYPIVSLGAQTMTFAFYRDWFGQHGLVFQPDMETATADQILPLVRNHLGIGFVPERFLENEPAGILRIRLAEPIPPRAVCYLKRADAPLSIAAKELERMILEEAHA